MYSRYIKSLAYFLKCRNYDAALLGVPRSKILKHLEQKKYSAQLMDDRTISSLISAAESHVTSSFESDPKVRNVRLAQCSKLARIKNDKDVGRSETLPESKRGLQLLRVRLTATTAITILNGIVVFTFYVFGVFLQVAIASLTMGSRMARRESFKGEEMQAARFQKLAIIQ